MKGYTDTQTDPCIELLIAQLKMAKKHTNTISSGTQAVIYLCNPVASTRRSELVSFTNSLFRDFASWCVAALNTGPGPGVLPR